VNALFDCGGDGGHDGLLKFQLCLQGHMALGVWKHTCRCGVPLLKVSWVMCLHIELSAISL